MNTKESKRLYSGEQMTIAKNINGYLLDADDVFIESRKKPICDVPDIGIGNQPIDNGQYLFTMEEMDAFIKQEPGAERFFKPWYGSWEFINRQPRYCLSPTSMMRHLCPQCLEKPTRPTIEP